MSGEILLNFTLQDDTRPNKVLESVFCLYFALHLLFFEMKLITGILLKTKIKGEGFSEVSLK